MKGSGNQQSSGAVKSSPSTRKSSSSSSSKAPMICFLCEHSVSKKFNMCKACSAYYHEECLQKRSVSSCLRCDPALANLLKEKMATSGSSVPNAENSQSTPNQKRSASSPRRSSRVKKSSNNASDSDETKRKLPNSGSTSKRKSTRSRSRTVKRGENEENENGSSVYSCSENNDEKGGDEYESIAEVFDEEEDSSLLDSEGELEDEQMSNGSFDGAEEPTSSVTKRRKLEDSNTGKSEATSDVVSKAKNKQPLEATQHQGNNISGSTAEVPSSSTSASPLRTGFSSSSTYNKDILLQYLFHKQKQQQLLEKQQQQQQQIQQTSSNSMVKKAQMINQQQNASRMGVSMASLAASSSKNSISSNGRSSPSSPFPISEKGKVVSTNSGAVLDNVPPHMRPYVQSLKRNSTNVISSSMASSKSVVTLNSKGNMTNGANSSMLPSTNPNNLKSKATLPMANGNSNSTGNGPVTSSNSTSNPGVSNVNASFSNSTGGYFKGMSKEHVIKTLSSLSMEVLNNLAEVGRRNMLAAAANNGTGGILPNGIGIANSARSLSREECIHLIAQLLETGNSFAKGTTKSSSSSSNSKVSNQSSNSQMQQSLYQPGTSNIAHGTINRGTTLVMENSNMNEVDLYHLEKALTKNTSSSNNNGNAANSSGSASSSAQSCSEDDEVDSTSGKRKKKKANVLDDFSSNSASAFISKLLNLDELLDSSVVKDGGEEQGASCKRSTSDEQESETAEESEQKKDYFERWKRVPIGTFRRSRRLSAPYLMLSKALKMTVFQQQQQQQSGDKSDEEAVMVVSSTATPSTGGGKKVGLKINTSNLIGSSEDDDADSIATANTNAAKYRKLKTTSNASCLLTPTVSAPYSFFSQSLTSPTLVPLRNRYENCPASAIDSSSFPKHSNNNLSPHNSMFNGNKLNDDDDDDLPSRCSTPISSFMDNVSATSHAYNEETLNVITSDSFFVNGNNANSASSTSSTAAAFYSFCNGSSKKFSKVPASATASVFPPLFSTSSLYGTSGILFDHHHLDDSSSSHQLDKGYEEDNEDNNDNEPPILDLSAPFLP